MWNELHSLFRNIPDRNHKELDRRNGLAKGRIHQMLYEFSPPRTLNVYMEDCHTTALNSLQFPPILTTLRLVVTRHHMGIFGLDRMLN
ncbi:hypothetical protein BGZ88_005008 [Linnemannia elongata]|nr:hypothetical protein BGZ88_005008 [Linnemannia elongata]